jgi:hypothetical protein
MRGRGSIPLIISKRGRLVSLLVCLQLLTNCAPRQEPPAPRQFRLGFWFWRTGEPFVYQGPALDVLYVQAGEVSEKGRLVGEWPSSLPPAKSYMAVLRFQGSALPNKDLLKVLGQTYRGWSIAARRDGRSLSGLQIDLDVPSSSLTAYASFLGDVRSELPKGARLSITALLDWFRRSARVGRVMEKVDEFVPQFYDAHPPGDLPRIAEVVSERFGDMFEDYGKPYWIGVAAFGRIERIRGSPPQRRAYRDLSPLDLYGSASVRRTGIFSSPAGERIVHYEVERPAHRLGLKPGDAVDMILPTRESVHQAVAAAQSYGPNCQGVLFFRWPGRQEALALLPGEVLSAAAGRSARGEHELLIKDGGCDQRPCRDLAVRLKDRLFTNPLVLTLTSSSPLDYLSPSNRVKVTFESRTKILVEVPGDTREQIIQVGRAFSKAATSFRLSVEEK